MQVTVTDEPTRLDTGDADPSVPGYTVVVVNEGADPCRVAARDDVAFAGADRGLLLEPGASSSWDMPTRNGLWAVADDAVTVDIPGANHADFGDYGVQPGDGTSTADDSDVRQLIADEFRAWADAIDG